MGDFKKYTVLVVDDDEVLRGAIAFDYKRKGFNVLTAGSGDEAFEIVLKNKVDIVLSDMRMPDGDGMSLLERIRIHDPKIPVVIFITGFADVDEKECIAKGARQVFSKPFDRKALMNSVLVALGI